MRGNETLSMGAHSLVSWRSALTMDRNITPKPWSASGTSVNYYNEPGSGMKDVHSWLKSLRLHKYSELFSSMNYHQMMSLTEDELESKGVTKGARHKIILNINKLKNRVNNLKALEQSLGDEGPQYVRQALNELKALLTTPIRAYTADGDLNNNLSSANMVTQTAVATVDSLGQAGDLSVTTYSPFCDFSSSLLDEDDLPGHITHVLSKICSIIMANPHLDDECLRMYAGCAERCLSHEAFTVNQKQQLCMYKQQVEALRCSSNGRRQANARQPRNWGTSNPFHENSANLIRALVSSGQFSNQDSLLLSDSNINRRSKLTGGNLGVSALCNCRNAPKFDLSNPGFPGMERELVRTRNSHNTRSSPHPYFNRTVQTKNSSSSPRHIPSSGQFMSSVLAGKELDPVTYNDSYLESLCIRMTEKVIGGVIG